MCEVTVKKGESLRSRASAAGLSNGAIALAQNEGSPSDEPKRQLNNQCFRAERPRAPFEKTEQRFVDFILCAVGINICFLLYGIMQEQIYVSIKQHGNEDGATGEKKGGPITAFVLVSQSMTNALVAWGWMKAGVRSSREKQNKHYQNGSDLGLDYGLLFLTAVCYACAMTCSNESLNYVSYPTATLAKSCKLLPTMIAGILVSGRNYSSREWLGASCIMVGILCFNFSGSGGESRKDKQQDSALGLILLFFSLAMDGCLSWCQGMLKQPARKESSKRPGVNSSFRAPTSLETMLWTNIFAATMFGPYSILTGQYGNGMYLLSLSNSIGRDSSPLNLMKDNFATQLLVLNLLAAAGQFFIFYTLDKFSPTVCTTLTTTRKFFSILLSVSAFGHEFTSYQWGSVILVFGGLYAQIVTKVFGNVNVPSPAHSFGASKKKI